MTNKQTYYVVFMGRRHGVYGSWAECQKNVLLYKGSVYKSYTSDYYQKVLFCRPNYNGFKHL